MHSHAHCSLIGVNIATHAARIKTISCDAFRHRHRPPRMSQRRVARAATTPEMGDQLDLEDSDFLPTRFDGYRRSGAYTPFELIDYCEEGLRHEVKILVKAPIEKCFTVWSDRLNWLQWFDMIEEIGFHEDDPTLAAIFYMYRWAKSPFLEFYTTFRRTEEVPLKHILEEPVEGTPVVVAVLFEEGSGEEQGSTIITLRISYLLATMLNDFAGPLAVYADVQEKLKICMQRMAAFIEQVDEEELKRLRGEDKDLIHSGFPKQRERRRQEEVKRTTEMAEYKEMLQQIQKGAIPLSDDGDELEDPSSHEWREGENREVEESADEEEEDDEDEEDDDEDNGEEEDDSDGAI